MYTVIENRIKFSSFLFRLLFFLPVLCVSQTNQNELTTQQIDSIVKITVPYVQASGVVLKKQFLWKKTCGGVHTILYTEKKNPHRLIKGIYSISENLSKKHREDIYAEFYYNDNLFFVRIKKITIKKNIDPITVEFDINYKSEIDNKINYALGFNVKEWIDNKNDEFLKFISFRDVNSE